MEALLLNVASAVAPAVALFLVTQALKLNAAIDKLPGLVKQVLTVVEAYLLQLAGGALGVTFGADIGGLDATIVQTAFITLFGWAIHKLFKTPVPA